MAATSSLLRIPEAPSTPICFASARSSGNTIVDSEAGRSPEALSAVGAVSAVLVMFGTPAPVWSGEGELSEMAAGGKSTLSPLSPVVMRSVSVTDFLSIPR